MTRSRKRKLRRLQAACAAVPMATGMVLLPVVAHSQQAPAGGLEEVIVTAQKRSQSLQEVPISLLALDGEKLAQLQVTSFDDYARFLPSVTFQATGPGQAQMYFRGIASGGDGLHAGSAPATGLYLDETPLTTIGGAPDLHVYDIARVEALAGPQGTLYGASSLSGTLRLITNKPDPTGFAAGYDLGGTKYGKGDAGGSFEGFVNIPLSDSAAVRLVGFYDKEGGYVDNIFQQRTYEFPERDESITIDNSKYVEKNFNDVETYGGRAALRVDLNDRWSVTPSLIYQQQKAGGTSAFDPVKGDLNVTDFRPDSYDDHWYQSALTVEGKISNFDLVYSGGYFERKVDNRADYSYYSVAYVNIPCGYDGDGNYVGYCYNRFADEAGNLVDPTQYTRFRDNYTKLTNEIRLSSPQDWRFRFVVGAFAQRQTDKIDHEFRVDNLPAFYEVTGLNDVIYTSQQDRTDRDYALFTEANFDLTERFELTAGIRGFRSKNTLFGFFGYNDNLSSNGEAKCEEPRVSKGKRPCVNTRSEVTESGETHKVSLKFQVDADKMLYATYSTGFRPGGPNRRNTVRPYDSDTLSNFELGWKTSWLENSLRFNGAVFYEKWKDVQLAQIGAQGITDVFNVGDAKSTGIEGDLSWAATDNLLLSLSGTYVKTELTTDFCEPIPDENNQFFVPGSCAADARLASKGTQLPVTPKFKGNASARYTFQVGEWQSFVQGAVVHQGTTRSGLGDSDAQLLGNTPAFTSFDFTVGANVGNWNAELYVQNAFDERGETSRFGQCAIDDCLGQPRLYTIKPQMFGIRFGQKFGGAQ